jgi:hypothetical protein
MPTDSLATTSSGSKTSTIYNHALTDKKAEIRLVRMSPGLSESNDIVCQLETVELAAAPKYIALSYCWGDPNDPETIMLNGQVFKVTKNLFAALNMIRMLIEVNDAGLPFWIDAICIDQSNNLEKSAQVPRMRAIYSKATIVFSWLGEASTDSHLAFSFIKTWISIYETLSTTWSDEILTSSHLKA